MPINYQDPKESLSWLFNPNTALPETDFAAAAAAIGGGMPGSMFAQNNQLRLRDSERINRLQIGQNLLQPYLNRESQQNMQSQQIAASAAQQAITESGAMSRLNAEQAGALQRALISGNQQAAHDLLTESGQNTRQAATITANLQEATMRNQAGILQSLLGYAGAQAKAGGGGDGGPAGTRGYVPLGYQSTDFSGASPGASSLAGFAENNRIFNVGTPARGSAQGGIPGLSTKINSLLRNYGL